jgi:hypothetical protein
MRISFYALPLHFGPNHITHRKYWIAGISNNVCQFSFAATWHSNYRDNQAHQQSRSAQ